MTDFAKMDHISSPQETDQSKEVNFERMRFLDKFENRDSFFERISWLFPKRDERYKLIEKAYNDAKDAFRGVYREDKETRYFEHIRATALILIEYLRVKDYELIVAALLYSSCLSCE